MSVGKSVRLISINIAISNDRLKIRPQNQFHRHHPDHGMLLNIDYLLATL